MFFPVLLRSIKEKHKNVSFLRFVGFSKNLSKLFSGTVNGGIAILSGH